MFVQSAKLIASGIAVSAISGAGVSIGTVFGSLINAVARVARKNNVRWALFPLFSWVPENNTLYFCGIAVIIGCSLYKFYKKYPKLQSDENKNNNPAPIVGGSINVDKTNNNPNPSTIVEGSMPGQNKRENEFCFDNLENYIGSLDNKAVISSHHMIVNSFKKQLDGLNIPITNIQIVEKTVGDKADNLFKTWDEALKINKASEHFFSDLLKYYKNYQNQINFSDVKVICEYHNMPLYFIDRMKQLASEGLLKKELELFLHESVEKQDFTILDGYLDLYKLTVNNIDDKKSDINYEFIKHTIDFTTNLRAIHPNVPDYVINNYVEDICKNKNVFFLLHNTEYKVFKVKYPAINTPGYILDESPAFSDGVDHLGDL